jgi:ArsR family transcriptional regulator
MTKRHPDPRPVRLSRTAQAAKALGHPTRLRLLAMLRESPLCVCQLTAVLEQATSTVSGHLLELKRADLVAEEKHGKWVEYRLRDDGPFGALIARVLDAVGDDAVVDRDARLVRGLAAVPLDVLCRAKLDLKAAGVKPAAWRARAAAPPSPEP